MNLLHVISSVNPSGGGPIEGIRNLGATLESSGHRVEIASLDPPNADYLRHTSLPVHALGPSRLGYNFSTRFIPWLRANRGKYDAVIVNGIWQFHSFGTWRALRNSSTPYVLFTHGMLDPWFKKEYPLKHLKKWMYWPWADYRVLRDAQAVLFTCEEERLLARESFWLYRCNEAVVSYGTARPKGEPKQLLQQFIGRYPELRDKKIVLFMGRIHPKKGCDLLIEAFAKVFGSHLDWHLVMAGPDQVGWQSKLQHRAEELGLAPQITWTGMVSGELKWGALRAAEVFALPSHQENFGIAVAEALAVGVPTLISNKVNIWREIQADSAGIVADDTLQGTCELLQSYLDMPDRKKIEMSQHAWKCFEQRFEIERAAESLSGLLTKIASANSPAFN
jgi:glycosyltransferase involved in cell wall biosynthesis